MFLSSFFLEEARGKGTFELVEGWSIVEKYKNKETDERGE